jgi:hypothetical protein
MTKCFIYIYIADHKCIKHQIAKEVSMSVFERLAGNKIC